MNQGFLTLNQIINQILFLYLNPNQTEVTKFYPNRIELNRILINNIIIVKLNFDIQKIKKIST